MEFRNLVGPKDGEKLREKLKNEMDIRHDPSHNPHIIKSNALPTVAHLQKGPLIMLNKISTEFSINSFSSSKVCILNS